MRKIGYVLLMSLFSATCVVQAQDSVEDYVQGKLSEKFFVRSAGDTSATESVIPAEFDAGRILNLQKLLGLKKYQEKKLAVISGEIEAEKDGWFLLGMGADWWLECEVNGEMVFSTMAKGNDWKPISIDNYLIPVRVKQGKNTILLKIKSGSNGFNVALGKVQANPVTLERLAKPKILHGPWLSNSGEGRTVVRVIGSKDSIAYVEYREKGASDWMRAYEILGGQVRNDKKNHQIILDKLSGGKEYEYRVVLSEDLSKEENVPGEVHTFTAWGENHKNFKFFFTSDTQVSHEQRIRLFQDFRKNCHADEAELVVCGGDLASQFDDSDEVFLKSFADVLTDGVQKSKILAPIRGNHEYRGRQSVYFFRNFADENGKSYYAMRSGAVCFIVLDCGEDKPRRANDRLYTRTFDRPLMEEQRKWLEKLVESEVFKGAAFRVVFAHSQPCQGGYMGKAVDILTDGLFTGAEPKHKIHLWMSGHTHSYTRMTQPGSGKQRSRNSSDTMPFRTPPPFVVMINEGPSRDGTGVSGILVECKEKELEIKSMEQDGRVFDHFAIGEDGKVREIQGNLKEVDPVRYWEEHMKKMNERRGK